MIAVASPAPSLFVCGLNNWALTECDSSRRITAMAKQDAEVAVPTMRSCNNEDSSGK